MKFRIILNLNRSRMKTYHVLELHLQNCQPSSQACSSYQSLNLLDLQIQDNPISIQNIYFVEHHWPIYRERKREMHREERDSGVV